MDQGPLVAEQIEAGNDFVRAFEASVPVVAAFWLKEADDGRWNFYVASDRFEPGNYRAAYGKASEILRELNAPAFDPFRLNLIGLHEPVARAAVSFYQTHPAKIPHRIRGLPFGGIDAEEVYLVRGPTGDYTMPSGREVLNHIIDAEAAFFQKHGKPPRKMKLPVLMAYDLAKCGRNEIGDLSGRVFMDGITVFEKEGFHGMGVEIVRDNKAVLEFE